MKGVAMMKPLAMSTIMKKGMSAPMFELLRVAEFADEGRGDARDCREHTGHDYGVEREGDQRRQQRAK